MMKRKTYSDKFKRDAILRVMNGEGQSKVAEDLEINQSTLGNWVKAAREDVADKLEAKVSKPSEPQKFVRRRINAWKRVSK